MAPPAIRPINLGRRSRGTADATVQPGKHDAYRDRR